MARSNSFSLAQTDDGLDAAPVSSGEFPGGLPRRRVDLHRARAKMPALWSAFIRDNFRNATEAAFFFDCDPSTARAWFEGVSAPRAEIALIAAVRIPGALAVLAKVAA